MAARTALCSSAIASSIETPADTSTAFAAALPSPLLTWATTVSRHAAAPGAAEVRLPLVAGDDAGLVADDRLHELVPAGKAVIHLRPAHTRRLDVTESGTRHAPLADQPRSAAQPHPRSARGPAPLGGEPRPALLLASPSSATVAIASPARSAQKRSNPALRTGPTAP